MNIPMPSEAEKRNSISYIKSQGIEKRENLLTVISDVYRNIGIHISHILFIHILYKLTIDIGMHIYYNIY